MQIYDVEFQTYDSPNFIYTNCNGFQLINYGDRPAIINKQITLQQNQTLTITGNEGEICSATLSLTFDTSVGTVQNVVIVRKLMYGYKL